MLILVVGGSGFLGRRVCALALERGHEVAATYFSQPTGGADVSSWRVDVRAAEQVAAVVGAVRPDVVVNTAYRMSDWVTTADGAAHVALAAARFGARLVHVSTESLFSGRDVFYDEQAVPDPVSPYGAAKAAAETAVAAIAADSVIVRTSLILGDGSPMTTLVHRLANGGDGVLFTDNIHCAVHIDDLAGALLDLAASDRRGVHHVAGPEPMSRYDIGRLIALRDGLDPDRLRAGSRADRGVPGPLDIRLIGAVTQSVLATRIRGVSEILNEERHAPVR